MTLASPLSDPIYDYEMRSPVAGGRLGKNVAVHPQRERDLKGSAVLRKVKRVLEAWPGLVTFVLSALTLGPFASMGLDVTDPGFNQLMVGRIGLNCFVEQP